MEVTKGECEDIARVKRSGINDLCGWCDGEGMSVVGEVALLCEGKPRTVSNPVSRLSLGTGDLEKRILCRGKDRKKQLRVFRRWPLQRPPLNMTVVFEPTE
jgi:hypothetical protein